MPQKAGKEGSGSARTLLLTHREKSWATSAADTQPSCRHWSSGHGTTTTASCNEVTTAQPWGYLAAETQALSHLEPTSDQLGLRTRDRLSRQECSQGRARNRYSEASKVKRAGKRSSTPWGIHSSQVP